MLNIGTLIQPTTLAQYKAGSVPLPPKLFSHNDQQSFWQSSQVEGAPSGWGGRIGDLFLSSNATSTFTCINVSGNAVFMTGQNAVQYQVGASGPTALRGATSLYGSQACASALNSLIRTGGSRTLENEHSAVVRRALDANAPAHRRTGRSAGIGHRFRQRQPAGHTIADGGTHHRRTQPARRQPPGVFCLDWRL
jgi:uncharacterized protein (DUF1501 family)